LVWPGLNQSIGYINWYMYQFWRGVFVQQQVAKLGQTFVDFPPMQKGVSFNLAAVKEQVEEAMAARHGN
jgi:arylsulfatase